MDLTKYIVAHNSWKFNTFLQDIEFKGKKYDVITCENLPAHNSSKELNAIFKERQVENILFATYLLSQNAKEKSPLLVSG